MTRPQSEEEQEIDQPSAETEHERSNDADASRENGRIMVRLGSVVACMTPEDFATLCMGSED